MGAADLCRAPGARPRAPVRILLVALLACLGALGPALPQRLLTLNPTGEIEGVQGAVAAPQSTVAASQRTGAAAAPVRTPARVDLDLLRSGPPVLELVAPDGEVITVERGYFGDRGNGNVTWTGRLAGNSYDSVQLTLENGHLLGFYDRPDGQIYDIQATSDGKGHVQASPPESAEAATAGHSHAHTDGHDHTDEHPEWCEVRIPPLPPSEGQAREQPAPATVQGPPGVKAGDIQQVSGAQTDPVTIRVLVLYTAGAAARLGDERETFFQGGVDLANTILRNNSLNAVYEYVSAPMPDATEVLYETFPGVWIDILQYHRPARELRSIHRADLVSVWAVGPSTVLCGLGWARPREVTGSDAAVPQPNARFWEYGLSENNLRCSQDNRGYWMTFAHELGHNLGGHHERAIVDDEVAFWAMTAAYGYVDLSSYPSQRARHTVMAYGPRNTAPGSTRIPWFSHPATVVYAGQPVTAGQSGSADVANVARVTLPLTARMSDHVPPASPTLNPPVATVFNSGLGVYLSWTDRSPNEYGFAVELRTSGGGG